LVEGCVEIGGVPMMTMVKYHEKINVHRDGKGVLKEVSGYREDQKKDMRVI
jgi:hypothetical protein